MVSMVNEISGSSKLESVKYMTAEKQKIVTDSMRTAMTNHHMSLAIKTLIIANTQDAKVTAAAVTTSLILGRWSGISKERFLPRESTRTSAAPLVMETTFKSANDIAEQVATMGKDLNVSESSAPSVPRSVRVGAPSPFCTKSINVIESNIG